MELDTYGSLRSVRCSAKSTRSGAQCKRWAIWGGTVCPTHGGSAPQVRAAARARLAEMVHPAIDRLGDLLGSDDERIALQAVRVVLDRATDEQGDPMGLPLPSADQIARWIEELEAQANE